MGLLLLEYQQQISTSTVNRHKRKANAPIIDTMMKKINSGRPRILSSCSIPDP